jgi:hypothetical protein
VNEPITRRDATTILEQQHIATNGFFLSLTTYSLYSQRLQDNKRDFFTMPQHHTATGTLSYPDAKSSYPAFPKVGFGRAVAIGIGAGFVGAFVYVLPLLPLGHVLTRLQHVRLQ